MSRYAAHADFLLVYVLEAHTPEAWRLGRVISANPQHKTLQDRVDAAGRFVAAFGITAMDGLTLVVDGMGNEVNTAYSVWPERMVVIQDGVVKYVQHGDSVGSVGLWTEEAEAWLTAHGFAPAEGAV